MVKGKSERIYQTGGFMTDNNEITREEIAAWQAYQLGKPCAKHPAHIIKNGKYGLYCGTKTAFGWCDGGWPTEAWLMNFRQEVKNETR